MGGEQQTTLSVAEALEADLTVGEIVEAKMTELAGICRTTAPETVLEQQHADWLMQEIAKGWPAAVLLGLVTCLPRVELGETCGEFGTRVLVEVSGG